MSFIPRLWWGGVLPTVAGAAGPQGSIVLPELNAGPYDLRLRWWAWELASTFSKAIQPKQVTQNFWNTATEG